MTRARQKSGNEMFAQLLSMRNQAGAMHYKRIALADELLKDRVWVESPSGGGGDLNLAYDRLEALTFGDLCGAMSMAELLEVYHNVPNEQIWNRHHYNLKSILTEYRASLPSSQQRDPFRREYRSGTQDLPDPAVWQQETPSKQRQHYEKAWRLHETDAQKITRLQEENRNLKQKVVDLSAKLKMYKQTKPQRRERVAG